MVSLRKTIVAGVVAGGAFWIVGMDLAAGIVAAFAFILVLTTTRWTVVIAAVAAVALFFAGELLVRAIELVFPDPRFSYAIVFFVGLVAGAAEDKLIGRVLG